jgi:hypothetical protein
MSTSSVNALLRAARSCVAEAARADRRGEYRYARELRQSARNALAEVRAMTPPVAVDPETAKRQERTRAFAAVLMQGLH